VLTYYLDDLAVQLRSLLLVLLAKPVGLLEAVADLVVEVNFLPELLYELCLCLRVGCILDVFLDAL
jgi:hypothetical protein